MTRHPLSRILWSLDSYPFLSGQTKSWARHEDASNYDTPTTPLSLLLRENASRLIEREEDPLSFWFGWRSGVYRNRGHVHNFQIQLTFSDPFKLQRPNECDANFVDVFKERTDMSSREKNFCGSIADTVVIGTNTAFVRFYAEPKALNSSFEAVMTALRDRDPGDKREFPPLIVHPSSAIAFIVIIVHGYYFAPYIC